MSGVVQADATSTRPLRLALINNMPRAARGACERQFLDLLSRAGGGRIDLVRMRLEGIDDPDATASLATPASLEAAGLHALVVTGAEPVADRLEHEPFWLSIAAVAEWAATRPVASYWSCLAAHAAVLHLDGIHRRPLPAKCSGVFEVDVARGARLMRSLQPGAPCFSPHSRYNGLAENELVAAGLVVETRARSTGVDAFVRPGAGLFLLHQGHPEYGRDALAQEWRRDLRRLRDAERATAPDPPQDYFEAADAEALERLWGCGDRRAAQACLLALSRVRPSPPRWDVAAVGLFSGWLRAARGVEASACAPSRRRSGHAFASSRLGGAGAGMARADRC